ncbi:FAD-binding domain-containing protein [Daedaleopsis nitida]|nr:FAD-binding domain-containing protein [Daedaleopsis nitida]
MRSAFIALVLALVPSSRALSAASLPAADVPLVQCLKNASLDPVVQGNPSYLEAVTPFNLRITDLRPVAVVYPKDTEGVAAAVICGAKNNVKVNARGGGHSYAAYGLGGKSGHLIVSLDNIRHLSMNGSYATIGAGNRLGDVALYLWNNGKRAMAHGTCPFVGIGGHAGQGGFGPASRAWGLLADQVMSMEIVLANGSAVTASSSENRDLFWAARGAGASFGIITSFTTVTHAAPDSTAFSYTFPNYTAAEASKGLLAWQRFVGDTKSPLDPNVGLELHITPGGKNGAVFSIDGTYYTADESSVTKTMAPLLKDLGPHYTQSFTKHDWIHGVLSVAGNAAHTIDELNTTNRKDSPERFFATSTFVTDHEPLKAPSAEALMSYLYAPGKPSNIQWFVFMDLYGGGRSAVTSRSADFNAFDARDALYSIQYYGTFLGNVSSSAGVHFIQGMKNTVEDNQNATFKEYVNYIDSTYSADVAHRKYYPSHTERLKKLKDVYDPDRVIHHPQDFS